MDFRILGGVLWIEAMLWSIGCALHYSQVPELGRDRYLRASTYLRRVFGNLRQDGTLSLRGVVIQGGCYAALVTAILFAVQSALSRQVVILIIILQILATGLLILTSIVLLQVRKQNQ